MSTLLIILCFVWVAYNTYQLSIIIKNGMFTNEDDLKDTTPLGIFVAIVLLILLGPFVIGSFGKKRVDGKSE